MHVARGRPEGTPVNRHTPNRAGDAPCAHRTGARAGAHARVSRPPHGPNARRQHIRGGARGGRTRKGPLMPLALRWVRKPMVWTCVGGVGVVRGVDVDAGCGRPP